MKHMVHKRPKRAEQIILKLGALPIKRRLNRLQFVRRKNRRRGEIRCDGSKATAHVAFSRNDPQVLTSNGPPTLRPARYCALALIIRYYFPNRIKTGDSPTTGLSKAASCPR